MALRIYIYAHHSVFAGREVPADRIDAYLGVHGRDADPADCLDWIAIDLDAETIADWESRAEGIGPARAYVDRVVATLHKAARNAGLI